MSAGLRGAENVEALVAPGPARASGPDRDKPSLAWRHSHSFHDVPRHADIPMTAQWGRPFPRTSTGDMSDAGSRARLGGGGEAMAAHDFGHLHSVRRPT